MPMERATLGNPATPAAGRLLGWYHSHPGQALALTTHDVETHVKFFTEPWQVAILVAAEAEGVVGGFFRSGSSQAWAETPLAFYELLQPDSIRADGKKRSYITWKNYKAYNPVAAKPAAKAPPPPPPPPPPADDPPAKRNRAGDPPITPTPAGGEPAPAPRGGQTPPGAPRGAPRQPPPPPPPPP